jgi:hypothetical protein
VVHQNEITEVDPETLTVGVSPVTRQSRQSAPALAVTFVVAFIAFAAGTLVAGPGTSRSTSSASPSPSPVPTTTPAASELAFVPGSSGFFAGFDGAAVISGVEHGRSCEIDHASGVGTDASIQTGSAGAIRVWTAFCPLAKADRQTFVESLWAELDRTVPGSTTTGSESGDRSESSFPYRLPGRLAGFVAVVSSPLRDGLQVVIIAEEHRG